MTQVCLTCKSVKNIKNSTYKTKKPNWKKCRFKNNISLSVKYQILKIL